MRKILAISGSLRAASSNTRLLRAMAGLAPGDVAFTLYDGLDYLPHFSPERDGENPPASVVRLRGLVSEADGVVFCTPEYAFGMPGVLKNGLDWLVSSGELDTKPVAVLSASPLHVGAEKAHAALVLTLTALGANRIEDAYLMLPGVNRRFDADGVVSDAETRRLLRDSLDALLQSLADARPIG